MCATQDVDLYAGIVGNSDLNTSRPRLQISSFRASLYKSSYTISWEWQGIDLPNFWPKNDLETPNKPPSHCNGSIQQISCCKTDKGNNG